MTPEDEALLRKVFELTAEERLDYVRKGRRTLAKK
jgi:DNA-binding TFAR19-related protein (PDSD5 family)